MANDLSVSEVRDLAEYESVRNDVRRRIVGLRKLRRVQLGDRITLVFENRDTLLFQIHEAMRAEGITDREALQAECDVYASLMPNQNELSATMTILVSGNGGARAELDRLAGIEEHTCLCVADQDVSAVAETGDPGDRTAVVRHVRFRFDHLQRELFRDSSVPAKLRVTHPDYEVETLLAAETRRLLIEDLA